MTEERAEYLVGRYADLLLRIGRTWLDDMDDARKSLFTARTAIPLPQIISVRAVDAGAAKRIAVRMGGC